ncbi:MAG TPA: TrbI/VirB10 family protein [Pseudoxanthomonas sp.]
MNQHIPPNPSGRQTEHGDPDSEPGQARDSGTGNPYYANQQSADALDLDANAPLLKSNDLQRLNRKALIFLAGIVALLVVAAVWMFNSATSGKDEASKKPREETVQIPELPQAANGGASGENVQPIEVAQYSQPELPPLPVEQTPQSAYPPSSYDASEAPPTPREPTLMERRMSNAAGGGTGTEAGAQAGSQQDPYMQAMLAQMPGNQANAAGNPPVSKSKASSAQFINSPDALLVRGTYIRCVLETRIITDIPGFTSCVVTEPIYSINGRRLLLPKGSKISGSYESEANGPRISVIWDRITTPNGIDVSMASPGVDNLGGAGHPGDYNAHWGSRIASALMISLISDAFKYAGAKHGPTTTTVSNGLVTEMPFESNTARTTERLANQAVDRSLRRPATVTINQGTVVNVYVSKDVDFSGVLARN